MTTEIVNAEEQVYASLMFTIRLRHSIVGIEIQCRDDYESNILFDDIVDRLKAGEPVTIAYKAKQK